VFVLGNPSSVELLFPTDGDQSVTQFPLFQWRYDGSLSRVSVFERLPGQTTLEEATSGVPHLVQEVAGLSLQYPTAGVRTLQPGKTYVWFVDGLVRSAGGTIQTAHSALRSFTVSTGGSPAIEGTLLDRLERALGPRYKSLFDQLRTNAYNASGDLMLNNRPMNSGQLDSLLNLIRQNPNLVTGAHVE